MWSSIVREEPSAVLATDSELDAFEARRHVRLPADHRQFLKIYGEGVLYNHFRIFGLTTIEEQLEETQERWQSYFFWDGADSALSEDEIGQCVIIGGSFNADELVLSPAHPGEIFYLPPDEDTCLALGSSLEHALDTLVAKLKVEIARYPEDEQDDWDLRPVFNREQF